MVSQPGLPTEPPFHSSLVPQLDSLFSPTRGPPRQLYRWAVTIFTSRSFSSRALHPPTNKYWPAYKQSSSNQRQTVVLDLSQVVYLRVESDEHRVGF